MASDEHARRREAIARDLDGGRDAPIEIVDHRPSWREAFAREADRLAALVPGLRPHHIGSTAVPGLAAKPVIDLMALVDDLDGPVAALVGPSGGYSYPEAYNATLAHRRWLCRPLAAHRTHHLHLVDREEMLERHLRFRDALRADPELAARYGELKHRLAAAHGGDRDAYTAAKREFVADALDER